MELRRTLTLGSSVNGSVLRATQVLRSAPTLHSQNPLDQLIRAPVFLCCLLDCLTCRIPYAEPGDLGSIFPTQQCRTRDTYQVQAVAVTEQRSPLGVLHARRLVS